MKHKFLFFSLFCLLIQPTWAQFMQGSAPEGVSSLIGGKTISFDISKTNLRFDYTGKFGKRSVEAKNNSGANNTSFVNWGTSLIAGNNDNIGQLLTKGTFTPASNVSAFIFWGKTLNQAGGDAILQPLKGIGEELDKTDKKFRVDLNAETNRLIGALADPLKTRVHGKITSDADNIGALILDLKDFRKEPATTNSENTELSTSINKLVDLETNFKQDKDRLELLERQKSIQQEYQNFDRLNPYKRIIIYARTGTSATKYKFYDTLDTKNFTESFTDTLFTGGFGEIGLNFYSRSYLIWGLAAGIIGRNTLQSASAEKIAIEESATDALGQKINSKQEVTAYQGKYQQYQQTYIKGDVVVLLPASERGTFAVNPYFHYAIVTDNTVPNSLKMGINGYFFNDKGKFLGGLFIERNYTFTSINVNPISVTRQGLNFGLRASFLFSTVFDSAKPNP